MLDHIEAWRHLPPSLPPSPENAKRVIIALERQFNVNRLTYNGIRIWPWLRNALIFFYGEGRGPLIEPFGSQSERSDRELLRRANRWMQRYEEDGYGAAAIENLPQRDILFINYGSARGLRINNIRIDTRLDPLIECVHKRWTCAKVLVDNTSKTFVPDLIKAAWINHDYYLRSLNLLDQAHSSVFSTRAPSVQGWDAFSSLLPNLLNRDAKVEVDVNRIANTMRAIEHRALYIAKILEKVRPRLAVSVGKNVSTHGLFLACRRANITTADVQHGAGAASPSNIKWFGWRRTPPEGYELLPDHFLVWDENSAERIRSTTNNPRRHTPIVAGDQWLNFGRDLAHINADGMNILVTLTQLDIAPPPPVLLKAIAKAPAEWRWRIRAHPSDLETPGMLEKIAQQFVKYPNVEVIESSSAPLPALLARVQRHVTMYSSVAIEASAFGVGTIFIHPHAKEFFAWLLERQGFVYAESSGDIVALLKADLPTPERLVEIDPAAATRAFNLLLTPTATENSAAS